MSTWAAKGVVAMNVGRTETDLSLVEAMTTTMSDVWPRVFVLEEPVPKGVLGNVLVIGMREQIGLESFADNIAGLPKHLPGEFRAFAATAVAQVRVEIPDLAMKPWIDDKDPIERIVWNWLVNSMAVEQ